MGNRPTAILLRILYQTELLRKWPQATTGVAMTAYTSAVIRPSEGNWQLVTPLSWEVGKPGTGLFIEAPAGFVTDLASIPRWGRFAFNPGDGRTAKAAIVHDFLLYEDWCHMTAAGEFYNALRADGVVFWRRLVMFLAVLAASDRW